MRVMMLSVGGVLGVNARYWLAVGLARWSERFPWATFLINVSGSFAIGFFSVLLLRRWPQYPNVRLFLVTGFLGGYTTFSTFALESLALWERGDRALSLAYMAGSVTSGFVGALLGLGLARLIVGVPGA